MTERAAPADRSRRRQARSAETREAMIAEGLKQFPALGYTAVTVDGLLRDLGLTRGAFYFHFAGKEEFFLEVLRARAALRPAWWELVRDPGVTGVRSALVAAFARFSEVEERGRDWLFPVVDFHQATGGSPGYAAALDALYRDWIGEIVAFIEECRARGFVRTDVAVEPLAAEVFATVEGYTIHTRIYRADPATMLDALERILRP